MRSVKVQIRTSSCIASYYHTKAFLLGMVLLWPLLGSAQKSMTFREAQQTGIFEKLDQKYKGGLDQDTLKAVFRNQTEYIKAYQDFLMSFGGFLRSHGFQWRGQVRCFNKIYFSRTGKVDYFLYNFSAGDITPDQEAEFAKLLSAYVRTARFKLRASSRFSQCSPVRYGAK